MDLKKNTILVSRIEESIDDDSKNSNEKNESTSETEITKEKEIYLGQVETTEHFEEEPQVLDGGLKSLIDAYSKKKANIYEAWNKNF